ERSRSFNGRRKPVAPPNGSFPRGAEVAVIAFDCAKCGKRLSVGEEFAGKTSQCPSCGEPTQVPDHSTEEPSPSASPPGETVLENPVLPPSSRRDALRTFLDEDSSDPARGRK